jgi:putative PIN family toxin of toxin-antitoxin system
VIVVVDTNVLVAGLLSPFGPAGEIVRMIASGSLTVVYDARMVAEYVEVLRRPKFAFGREHVEALLDQMKAMGTVAAGDPLPARLPDPNDEPFLEVALAGRAQCLITGNLKHFPPGARQGLQLFTPGEFVDFYRKRLRGKAHPG